VDDGDNTLEVYQSTPPYFTVLDGDRLIGFLVAAFGASVIKESRYDDSRIQHARLRIGNSIIMLNERSDDYTLNAVW